MPFHISTPFPQPDCLHCHSVAITTPSLFPSYCRGHPIPIVTFCYPIPIVTMLPLHPSFHLILIAIPCPPHLHCYPAPIVHSRPHCYPIHISTPSPWPPLPLCHFILISTLVLWSPHSHYRVIPIATLSLLSPCPPRHPIFISTLFPSPPHPRGHPILISTPSLSPPRGHPFVAGANRRPVPVASPRATRCCRSVSHHHVASGV